MYATHARAPALGFDAVGPAESLQPPPTVVQVAPAPNLFEQRSDCGHSFDISAILLMTIGLSVLIVLWIRTYTHA